MTLRVRFKRGDTFALQGTVTDGVEPTPAPIDITNWTIKSQIRLGNTLVAELTVTKPDAVNGVYLLKRPVTTTWRTALHQCDIEYTDPDGNIVSTETFEVDVVADVTRV